MVFACNRLTIKRNLDQLIKYRPDEQSFPIVVSQDCGHEPTRNLIQSYGSQLTLIQHPDLSDIKLIGKSKKFKGYYKIARHYKWALSQVFETLNYETVIIVEDDLDIAPDFFEYFRSTYPILKSDPTLWCVSAWNDNGKQGLIQANAGNVSSSRNESIILFLNNLTIKLNLLIYITKIDQLFYRTTLSYRFLSRSWLDDE